MVLFVKTKFARDKHGQTVAGLVGFQVKAQQRLDCVPFHSLRFLFAHGSRLSFVSDPNPLILVHDGC